MSDQMAGTQQACIPPLTASRLPEAMRIAREIMNNPAVSPAVRAIAASVIRRNGLPVKLDS